MTKKCMFIAQDENSDQQIKINFELNETDLTFDIEFEPEIEMNSELGLSGQLVDIFLSSLQIEQLPESSENIEE